MAKKRTLTKSEYERFDIIRDELWRNRKSESMLQAQLKKMNLKHDIYGKPTNFKIR